MKRNILIVISFVFLGSPLLGQEKIKWYTLEEAVALNRYIPKKFMVDVYTDWCGWCKRMDKESFSDSLIAAYVNENFYAVKFDAEMKESLVIGGREYKFVDNGRRGYHEMAVVLTKGQLSYPTIVYLDEKLRHIQVDPGFKNKIQLKERLEWVKEEDYKAGQVPLR